MTRCGGCSDGITMGLGTKLIADSPLRTLRSQFENMRSAEVLTSGLGTPRLWSYTADSSVSARLPSNTGARSSSSFPATPECLLVGQLLVEQPSSPAVSIWATGSPPTAAHSVVVYAALLWPR